MINFFPPSIESKLDAILSANNLSLIVPALPPLVKVQKGKHISQQKLGGLLNKLGLTSQEVKELVEEYKQANGDLSQFTVKYTTNFVEVYKKELYAIDSTSKSCMTGEDSVRVYDYDENLKLLTLWKDKTLLVGRTLVREDHKEFVRLYLDHNNIKPHIARELVKQQGYKEGDLEGIKLRYIEDSGRVVCPYLDKVSNFDIVSEEYLKICSSGEYDGATTDGYVNVEIKQTCECCGDLFEEDDLYYIEAAGGSICESCTEANYVYYSDDYFHKEDCVENLSTNELIPRDFTSYENMLCTDDGDWYNSDEVVCVDDCYFHISECEQLRCEKDNGDTYCLKSEAIEILSDIGEIEEGFYTLEQLEALEEELKDKIIEEHEEDFNVPCSESLNDSVEELKELQSYLPFKKGSV